MSCPAGDHFVGRVLSIRGGALAALLLAVGCGGEGEIQQPTPLYGEIPIEYPLQLWDQNMEGETLLRVRVTDTGQVDSIEVVESAGEPAFDSAAVAGPGAPVQTRAPERQAHRGLGEGAGALLQEAAPRHPGRSCQRELTRPPKPGR